MKRTDFTHHRSRLVLEPGEERHLRRLAGLARFAYNRGLEWEEERLTDGLPLLDVPELEERFRALCRESDLGWVRALPSDAWRNALKHLRRAYKLHDEQHLQHTTKAYHRNPPQRKRRGHSKEAFILSRPRIEETADRDGRRVITVIDSCGHRYLLHDGRALPEFLERPYQATVKELKGTWFITLSFREPTVRIAPRGPSVGVDLGFFQMAVDSYGNSFAWRGLSPNEGQHLRSLYVALRRTRPGSNARRRILGKIDRLRYRRSCVEWNLHHQASAAILGSALPAAERPSRVVLDHIDLTEIPKHSRTLEEAVKQQSLFQLSLKLRHKAQRQGTSFVEADKFYPSSKACFCCGHRRDDLTLGDRIYQCPQCGLVLDRDYNAALNLRDYERSWRADLRAKEERFAEQLWNLQAEPVANEPKPAPTPTTLPEGFEQQLGAFAARRKTKESPGLPGEPIPTAAGLRLDRLTQ